MRTYFQGRKWAKCRYPEMSGLCPAVAHLHFSHQSTERTHKVFVIGVPVRPPVLCPKHSSSNTALRRAVPNELRLVADYSIPLRSRNWAPEKPEGEQVEVDSNHDVPLVFEVLKFFPAIQVRGNIEVEIQGLVCRDDNLGRTISSTRPITTATECVHAAPHVH